MAEALVGSLYPPPPSFYKLYDPSNSTVLPPGPPEPVTGQYAVYGTVEDTADALPPLQGQKLISQDVRESADIKTELLRLNRQLVIAINQLIDVLAKTPSQYARAVEAVIAALGNMTYGVNLLRPVQARATLKHMLRLQVHQKRAAIQQLKSSSSSVVAQCRETVHLLVDPKQGVTGQAQSGGAA